jgi:hypothetical protein
MLDPTIMKQSSAHTKGSTLQNGIRQDAGGSEMVSATTVFSLGKIDMIATLSLLQYHSYVTLVPRAAIRPDRPLAHEHIDNKCHRTLSPRCRKVPTTLLIRYADARGRRNRVTAAGTKPAPSEQPFAFRPVTLTCRKHGRS